MISPTTTRGNADPGAQRRPIGARGPTDFRQDAERGANRAFGGILKGLGEAKIG